ncbi:MAG: hypothetical protein Ct9H300mP15_23740 [Gemmatimonadota bacterium]|nr:MAG: hypothetical protein Ct9H300mP15_23740 [Gemmatimonadota bacterium]
MTKGHLVARAFAVLDFPDPAGPPSVIIGPSRLNHPYTRGLGELSGIPPESGKLIRNFWVINSIFAPLVLETPKAIAIR